MNPKLKAGCCALAVTGLVSLAVPATAATSMPAEQYQGSVDYVTGGIGRSEARLFENRLTDHRLAIELLEHAGKAEEFTANASVKIADVHGHTVLDAKAAGPFMLVDLPSGRYSITATLKGDTLRKSKIWINHDKTTRVTFEFPAGTDDSIPVKVKVASAALETVPHSADWLHAGLGG
jgi:hypothetical protein